MTDFADAVRTITDIPADSGVPYLGYYATVQVGREGLPVHLLGPYATFEKAAANVGRAERYVRDNWISDPRWAYGATTAMSGEDLPLGKLNDALGLEAPVE